MEKNISCRWGDWGQDGVTNLMWTRMKKEEEKTGRKLGSQQLRGADLMPTLIKKRKKKARNKGYSRKIIQQFNSFLVIKGISQ